MTVKRNRVQEAGDIFKIFKEILALLDKYGGRIVAFTKEQCHKINLRLSGKTISIIGPVAAGKTTLLHVLKDSNITVDPMIYEKTTDPVQFEEKIFIDWKLPLDESCKNSEVIKLKIRKPKDVGGEVSIRDSRDGWIDVCKDTDFIFYLFDSYNYHHDQNLKKRLGDDFEWIANKAQGFKAGFKIVIFTNKMDKFLTDEEKATWKDNTIPEIENIAKSSLGAYRNHLALISPCSLLSNKLRTNSISLALKCLADLE